jgi:hypothetical protein
VRCAHHLKSVYSQHSLQIDINPFSEEGWAFTEASLRSLCERGGARLIRLDAFGYVTKKAGTSCFMQVRLLRVNHMV